MSSPIAFGPFRLDARNAQLWRGDVEVQLRPKTYAVLQYLAERPARLVTKEELLRRVWPDVRVNDGALKVCMAELRSALGDRAQQPQFIETVHGRGYRFIGSIPSPKITRQPGDEPSRIGPPSLMTALVGRDAELHQLRRCMEEALAGRRQLVFVTGEPGIGKTTLVEAFLECVAGQRTPLWTAYGQCVEHYGTAEAFLPVLEGLGRLCCQPGSDRLVQLLHEHAPSWLVQLPGLIAEGAREALQRAGAGMSRERMLRELMVGLEAVAADTPIVLVLEDLHWSDYSTIDLIAALARRHEPARLLIVATSRPVDALVNEHPLPRLTQELQLHRQCIEVPLHPLSAADVAVYLAIRFPGTEISEALAPVIHRCTGGTPLFVANIADHLVARGLVVAVKDAWVLHATVADVEREVPQSLRQMLQALLTSLSPAEVRTLAAASAAGVEFTAQELAAALNESTGPIEARCDQLARGRRFIRSAGSSEWPDGSAGALYAFAHALYRETLYEQLPAVRRTQLHRRIGERLEVGHRGHTAEVAAELAMHFERAGEHHRAISYYQQAGANAVHRHAHREAIAQFTKALALLETLPPTSERDAIELELRVALGVPLLNTQGFAAPDVERTYARARELCERGAEAPRLFHVLEGLHSFYMVRGDLPSAYHLAQELMRLAEAAGDRAQLLEGHHTLGCSEFWRGEFPAARAHFDKALQLYDARESATAFEHSGHDPKVCCLSHSALTLWFAGYPDQAQRRVGEAVAFAEALRHPESITSACAMSAWVHLLRGEGHVAQAHAESSLALAREHGFAYWAAQAAILRGWALSMQGDTARGDQLTERGLGGYAAIGAEIGRTEYLSLRADAYARSGRCADGLAVLAEAFERVRRYGERYLEPELLRLRGKLLLAETSAADTYRSRSDIGPHVREAETCFRRAIELARQQHAKSLELRAARSLSRLWLQQGKGERARALLRDVYGWFTEGFDTQDLRSAAMLLRESEQAMGSRSRRRQRAPRALGD